MAPFTKKKKKSAIRSLFNKMTIKPSYPKHGAHEHNRPAPSLESSEEEEEQEEEEEELEGLESPLTHTYLTSPYSLTSGPLVSRRRRQPSSRSSERSKNPHLQVSAPSSCISSSPSPSASLWEEPEHGSTPLIRPSDHLKALLSQLASTISASQTTFALLKASSSACNSLEYVHSKAQEAMGEELQTIYDLHMRLEYSLSQQLEYVSMKIDESYYNETSSNESMGLNVRNVERQEAMLKSYESIISRFHDEIRKKNAVTEALKETLAKSMLKSEKLERRMKALEMKLAHVQPN